MIPDNIVPTDVLKAIEWVSVNGVPRQHRQAESYLIFDDREYPARYLLAVANKFANGEFLNCDLLLSSHTYAERLLSRMGFLVKQNESAFPF